MRRRKGEIDKVKKLNDTEELKAVMDWIHSYMVLAPRRGRGGTKT